jgi:hypothetical protein
MLVRRRPRQLRRLNQRRPRQERPVVSVPVPPREGQREQEEIRLASIGHLSMRTQTWTSLPRVSIAQVRS